jgi:glycosyltransferase involved in cell wall biosynthesis
MNEPTIAVVIFGKNNEDTIERVLKNSKPFADEILYMDTGSTDRTLEIVRKYTKRIYIAENMQYRNNANYRNFLNSESCCTWTLFCDTDEYPTQQFANEIKGFLKQLENIPKAHHVYFKMAHLVHDEKHMLSTPNFHPFLYHPRLALKEFSKWTRDRHEIYIGEGEGIFWSIFGLVHSNLLNVARLRQKLINDTGEWGEYRNGGKFNRDATDEEVLKRFTGESTISEIPKDVIW